VLSNILLDKLDQFVETVLIPQYTKGVKRRLNKQYQRLMSRAQRRFKNGQEEAAQRLRKQAQRLPAYDIYDPNYRRLKYCRYADDFCLGFTVMYHQKSTLEISKRRCFNQVLLLISYQGSR
jgi:hypothetical protein